MLYSTFSFISMAPLSIPPFSHKWLISSLGVFFCVILSSLWRRISPYPPSCFSFHFPFSHHTMRSMFLPKKGWVTLCGSITLIHAQSSLLRKIVPWMGLIFMNHQWKSSNSAYENSWYLEQTLTFCLLLLFLGISFVWQRCHKDGQRRKKILLTRFNAIGCISWSNLISLTYSSWQH